MIIKLKIETSEFGNAKFWMKEKQKNLSNLAWKFWKPWYIKKLVAPLWNEAEWMKYSGLKNPVFLEKLNSANGPSQIQTVKQTLLSFDKENLNQTWIQLFEKVKKHRQTCLLQNNFCTESLILAQNERWRHGLGMQVERCSNAQWRKGEERVSNLPLSWE